MCSQKGGGKIELLCKFDNYSGLPSKIATVLLTDTYFHSLLCPRGHRAYTILVKDELIFLASHMFQAQIQSLHYSY